VAVLYGNPQGGFPDTTTLQTLDLAPVQGQNAMFIDVTGDAIPELVVASLDVVMRVYVGEPGLRLHEQFGSGNDGPDVAHGRAYRRPWAAFPLARSLDPAYPYGSLTPPYDIGDAGLDGVNDIWLFMYPEIVCYNSGELLDSLFDSYIEPYGEVTDVVKLGDIDGSGIPTIAVGYASLSNRFAGGVHLVKPCRNVSQAAEFRDLPHGPGIRCQTTAGTVDREPPTPGALQLNAEPNPSNGVVRFAWHGSATGTASIAATDLVGRAVWEQSVSAGSGTTTWSTEALPPGTYLVKLTTGSDQATVKVVLTR
jgi:hypothetical protein